MSEPWRIGLAGFQHETNSFSPVPADLAAFQMADSWPGLTRGAEMLDTMRGLNLPIAGAAQCAQDAGARLHPILWASAEPSGRVTDAAFDAIASDIIKGAAQRPLDALYLDLHGAMITDSHLDGEGALLARLRDALGPDLPIAVSLDMHANISPQMVALADAICVFRTYPHLDMAACGARSMARLLAILRTGDRPHAVLRQVPFLIPLHAQYTGEDPARALFAALKDDADLWTDMALGFPAGDTPHTCPAILAHGATLAKAEAAADALLTQTLGIEPALTKDLPTAKAAVAAALAYPAGKPVIIADVQDNPGGGGSSDTTGLLRALVAGGAQDVALAVMHDPQAAAAAHQAGEGATLALGLGGKSGLADDAPFQGRFHVRTLGDGQVRYEGEMYAGGTAQMGPSALLQIIDPGCDVAVIVSSVRNQALDRGYFRHMGLTPETMRLLAVKSTVHFRADFEPIAQAILPAAAPGALSGDLQSIPYKHLKPGLRLGPLGPTFRPHTT